jgi:hypothetical protein
MYCTQGKKKNETKARGREERERKEKKERDKRTFGRENKWRKSIRN